MTRTLGSDNGNQVVGGGRRIAIGWLSYGVHLGTENVTTLATQSLPRELTLLEDGEGGGGGGGGGSGEERSRLLQQFVPELQILRRNMTMLETTTTTKTGRTSVFGMGQQMEIFATFNHDDDGGGGGGSSEDDGDDDGDGDGDKDSDSREGRDRFGLRVFYNERTKMSTSILIHADRSVVCVNGTLQGDTELRCGPMSPPPPLSSSSSSSIKQKKNRKRTTLIHVYLDHTILEIIVNNATALTASVNPASSTSDGVVLDVGGSGTVVGEASVWTLASINEK